MVGTFYKYNKQLKTENTLLDFLLDNIFVVFGGTVFQQHIEIPMDIINNFAPIFVDLFLYSY